MSCSWTYDVLVEVDVLYRAVVVREVDVVVFSVVVRFIVSSR